MKSIVLAALALALAMPAMAQTEEEITNKYPGYTLAWREEFTTGSRPNTRDWEFETGYKRNNEAQYYTTKNATIEDGKLVIEARKNDDGHSYTSSSIIAKKRFHYGIYEICAKIPVGTGYWPAIWGTGNKYEWPFGGEIDIMEYYGDALHANVAWGSNTRWQATWNSKAPRMSNFEPDFADNFHVWKMVFTYQSIKLYVDDQLLNYVLLDSTVNPNPAQSWYNVDEYNPYRDESNTFGVWLNLALGGNCGGSLSNTLFPARYYVDYVRVYTPDTNLFDELTALIAEANALYDSTVEGDMVGEYPKEARDAFKAAIDYAAQVEAGDAPADIEAAIADLRAAMADYSAAVVTEAAGIYAVSPAAGVTAVYNLTGLRVASSLGALRDKDLHGVFIVVDANGSRKVIL